MEAATEPESIGPQEPIDRAYVVKSFSATRRAIKAAIVFLPALWLALYGWKNQIERGTLLADGWIPLAILAGTAFWATKIWRRKEVKTLATLTQPITAINPTKKFLIATGLLAAALGCVWYLQWDANQLAEYWWHAWPLAVVYVAYIVMLFMPQHRKELTLAAKEEYARLQQEQAQKKNAPAQPTWIDEVAEKWWARYSFGLVMLWIAFELAQSDHKNGWVGAIAAVIVALACMRELFWLLLVCAIGGGVLWALFGVMAALPVSVAIIIGAFIIASSMKK